jgi:hypothetical protein
MECYFTGNFNEVRPDISVTWLSHHRFFFQNRIELTLYILKQVGLQTNKVALHRNYSLNTFLVQLLGALAKSQNATITITITTPRPLYPRERTDTNYIGGWVGTTAGLNECGESRPHRDSIPGQSRS